MQGNNQRCKFLHKLEHVFHKKNIFLSLDKTIARSAGWQLTIVSVLFLVVFSVVCLSYRGDNNPVGKAFVDMISSGRLSEIVYDKASENNDIHRNDVSVDKPKDQQSPNPWKYAIIYLLGSVIFSGLLIATITNALRTRADRFTQGKVRYRNFRGHIVILGYNDMVPGMIERMFEKLDEPCRVIIGVKNDVQKIADQIFETINASDKSQAYRSYKKYILVLEADSNNVWDLKKRMLVHRAKEVYILGERDDAYSLNSYDIIRNLCAGYRNHPECYIQMQYQSTFALFQRYQNNNDKLEHFHAFNIQDTLAREIFTQHPEIDYRENGRINLGPDSNKHVHLVIVGMTEMGEALAREAAFRCHYPNYVTRKIRTRITFIDQEAKQYMTYFTGRYNHLFNLCHNTFRDISANIMAKHHPDKDFLDIEFEFIQANIADKTVQNELSDWATDDSQVLTIAICTDMPHRSMAAGLYLPDEIFNTDKNIPVWIYQPTKGNMIKYLEGSINRFSSTVTFGTTGTDLNIKNDYFVKQAKRLNYFYQMHKVIDDDLTYQDADIDNEWRDTMITEKWSTIYNVSAIDTKLRSIGGLTHLSDNIELLANVEHNRWNVEKLLMGFRPTTPKEHSIIFDNGYSNKHFKTYYIEHNFAHDDIRPFSELDEASKDMQRDYIREISKIIN